MPSGSASRQASCPGPKGADGRCQPPARKVTLPTASKASSLSLTSRPNPAVVPTAPPTGSARDFVGIRLACRLRRLGQLHPERRSARVPQLRDQDVRIERLVRGRFPVRGIGYQMSAPLAVTSTQGELRSTSTLAGLLQPERLPGSCDHDNSPRILPGEARHSASS